MEHDPTGERTVAAAFDAVPPDVALFLRDHIRGLEAEAASARALHAETSRQAERDVERLRRGVAGLRSDLEQARRELAAARAECERLRTETAGRQANDAGRPRWRLRPSGGPA